MYDAFVIYQRANLDDQTERRLAHFVNEVLPAVLEKECGFNLYIFGRDDLPGEGTVYYNKLHYNIIYLKLFIRQRMYQMWSFSRSTVVKNLQSLTLDQFMIGDQCVIFVNI